MKSRIHNNNIDGAKDMGTYFELPLMQFLIQMPQYASIITQSPIDINDKNYIVRFRFKKDGTADFELGYPEDSEWRIGEPDTSKPLNYPARCEELEKVLDAEIAKGNKFAIMTVQEYIEKCPNSLDQLSDYTRNNKEKVAICISRNEKTKAIGVTQGDIRNSREQWEAIINRLQSS